MYPFYIKSKILALIPQILVINHIKNLRHHIKNILLNLWLKYGGIWTNIVSFNESFSIKLQLKHNSWIIFQDT